MDTISTVKEAMTEAFNYASIGIKCGGGPFGCVICDSSGVIIAKGHNMVAIHNDPTLHAEIVAIKAASRYYNNFDLSNCTLYTSCEPCPMCLGAIYWAKITKIFYCNTRTDAKNIGFDDEFIYDEIKKQNEERKVKMNKIDVVDNLKVFRSWSEKEDKISY
jgi:tRNA(Arg) A34 adenosine deaminase TadA